MKQISERDNEIYRSRLNGETYTSLAARYNLSVVRIRQIYHRVYKLRHGCLPKHAHHTKR